MLTERSRSIPFLNTWTENFRRLVNSETAPSLTDYREYKLSAREWITYGAVGVAAAGVVAYVFYRSIWVFIVLAPLGALYPLMKRKGLAAKRSAELASQFREGITVLSSDLAAGYSMENAMREAASELRLLYGDSSMIVGEFEYINHRVSMNVPVERAWDEFAVRSGLDDVRNFARVIKVAKRSGGDMGEIIQWTSDVIGDKIKVTDEIRTMTAAKRLEQKVMNIVPVGIVIYIDATSPGFFDMMYTTMLGRVIMTVCLGVYAAAVVISGRILDIEV